MPRTSRVRSGHLWLFKVREPLDCYFQTIHFYSNKTTHSYPFVFFFLSLLSSYFSLLSFPCFFFFSFSHLSIHNSLFLAPSQKHIILHANLSVVRLDSLNMSLHGQSMQKMEVTLLVRNSGIGNPRNLRRRSRKKRRRSRGNNVRTIAPKRRRLEWLKRETNSALEPLLPANMHLRSSHHHPLSQNN